MTTVFVGNCQMLTLCELFRSVLSEDERRTVSYIANYKSISPAEKELLRGADQFVWQVTELRQDDGCPDDGRPCFRVPFVSGQFLYPLSGVPHPSNQTYDFCPDGPYPPEFGDALLNKMISENVSHDDALERYFETNVARERSVERLMEVALDRQEKRDELAGGYGCARLISDHFRSERLFLSRGHLGRRLNLYVATTLFEHMGLDRSAIERLQQLDPQKFVPPTELPIHPSIEHALGFSDTDDSRSYQFHFEGGYTRTEWASRYLLCTWSTSLMEGLWHFHSGRLNVALPYLEKARDECPRSQIAREAIRYAQNRVLTEEIM